MGNVKWMALPLVGLLLAACSGGSGEPDLEEGWDLMLLASEANVRGLDFDFDTREAVAFDDDDLPDGDAEQPFTDAEVTERAHVHLCERFLRESDSNLYQHMAVSSLLQNTMWVAAESFDTDYPDGYEEASRQIEKLVEQEARTTDGVSTSSDDYREIMDEQFFVRDELWASEYPEFAELREEVIEKRSAVYQALFSEPTVRSAQELYVDKCDIEVPDQYQYLSADELGLSLARDRPTRPESP